MSYMKSRHLLACLLAVSVIAGNTAGSLLSAGEIRASGFAESGPEIVEAEPVLTEEILTDIPGEETMTDIPGEETMTDVPEEEPGPARDDKQLADSRETVPAADAAELPETDPALFVPAERVTPADLEALKGEGAPDEIAAEMEEDIDVVQELLQLYPEDEGIYQMAAETGGLTDEAAADAAGAAADGTLRDEVTQEALENAGLMPEADETASTAELFPAFRLGSLLISDVRADDGSGNGEEDRISGRSIQFEPSDDPSGAMVRVSSFALIRKKDGSGDWDRPGTYTPEGDGYDWSGNDSSDGNGVVRTNDDVTYLMAYSTSLSERYMYNTVHGTRLYVSYTLPVPREAAEFRTEAMPWLKGDGPDGGPVLTEEDGVQILTGYRDLPDREDPGGSYDVPGAGTLNCIVRVKEMVSGSTLTPSFRAWIARASSNAAAPEDALACDTSSLSAEVRVTCGAYVAINLKKPSSTELSCFLTWKKFRSLYSDGSFREKNGRLKKFPFVITAGKPNGSLKGADRIDSSRRIRVYYTCTASSPEQAATDAGITDLVTWSMKDEEGNPACFWSGDCYPMPNGEAVRLAGHYDDDCGRITASGTENGQFYFDVEGFQNEAPGSVLSAGYILVNQEQMQMSSGREHYMATLTADRILASSASSAGEEQSFSQKFFDKDGAEKYPSCTIESEVDSSGGWDAHLLLTETWNSNTNVITGGRMSTAGVIGFGGSFGAMASQWHNVVSAAGVEKSKDWFILWDNTKLELSETDGSGFREQQCTQLAGDGGIPVRYVYITKRDGTAWSSRSEMLAADLRSFRDLRFWPDYASASAHGTVCGVLCESWGFNQEIGSKRDYDYFSVHLKPLDDPAVIGSSAMITFSIATYRTDIKKTASYADASDGMGTIPDLTANPAVRLWNMTVPRTYEATEWDESGTVKPSSVTAHNSVHEGNTVYIAGYGLKISDTLMSGLEAETYDLSATGEVRFRIEPGFTNQIPVTGAGADVWLPDPVTETGESPVSGIRLSAVDAGGEETELEEGTVYETGRFSEGATGSFVISRETMSELYNGMTLTGDPLDGKTVLLIPSGNPSLVLMPENGGTEGKTKTVFSERRGDKGSEAQQWVVTKVQEGTYRLQNRASGLVLHTVSGQTEAGTGTDIISAGSEDQSVQWTVSRQEDGSYRLCLMKSAGAAALGCAGSPAPGKPAVLTEAGGAVSWQLVSVGAAEPSGFRIRFSDLSSEKEFPVFLKTCALDKTVLTSEKTLTDTAVISGDGMPAVQSKANLHLGAASVSFTETSSDVLKMTADREKIRDGEEIVYTIRYTNQYDREHSFKLTDILPSPDEYRRDSGAVSVPQDADSLELGTRAGYASDEEWQNAQQSYAESLLTCLDEGGTVMYRDGSLRAETDLGSTADAAYEEGAVRAEGTLKPGETLTVTYAVTVRGGKPGNRIRNSCMAENLYGKVFSNRTETVIDGTPASEGPVLPLAAGGGGRPAGAAAGTAAALVSVFMWFRIRKKGPRLRF